jgi:hypothetical protein
VYDLRNRDTGHGIQESPENLPIKLTRLQNLKRRVTPAPHDEYFFSLQQVVKMEKGTGIIKQRWNNSPMQ